MALLYSLNTNKKYTQTTPHLHDSYPNTTHTSRTYIELPLEDEYV